MDIKTKYDLEQVVYPIYLNLGEYVVGRQSKVKSINVRVENHYKAVDYGLVGLGVLCEDMIFPTREEAQAECDRRNAEKE